METKKLAFADYEFDPSTSDLRRGSVVVPLTPKALAVLGYLATRPGRLVSKNELLDALWPDVFVGDGVLKVCVRELRRVLDDDAREPRFIETAHRRGYRFIAPVSEIREIRELSDPPTRAAAAKPVHGLTSDHRRVSYARSGDTNIAYQVLGNGPVDLVFVMGWVSHLEYFWREPSFAHFLERLATFSRLILLDKRGTGLSDPVAQMPTLEQRMDDVRAVMDAVGSRRAVLLGVSEGGPMCSLFSATYPSRTEALVMIGTYARRIQTADYPWAPTEEQREAFCGEILTGWGGPVGIEARAPSMAGDPAFREWWASYLRMGASPAAAVALTRMNARVDIRDVLPAVTAPTLVLHRRGDRCVRVEEGRYVASRIPEARFVELPGDDHLPFVGDADGLLDEIERFVGQVHPSPGGTRRLATILCATPGTRRRVESDELSVMIEMLVRTEAAGFGGGAIERTGDRVTVMFDGPARAIRCGRALSAAARSHGLPLKIGVHTGECDLIAGVAHGLAAEISTCIARLAETGGMLVSRTVVDLVAGSGLRFNDRGEHRLADGLSDWHVFTVEPDHTSDNAMIAIPLRRDVDRALACLA